MTLHTGTSSSRPTVTTTLLPHDQSSTFPTTYNVPIGGDAAEPWITLSQVDNLFHVKKKYLEFISNKGHSKTTLT